jgi:hypothetical protein
VIAVVAQQPAHDIDPVIVVDAELVLGIALADRTDTVLRPQHRAVVLQ